MHSFTTKQPSKFASTLGNGQGFCQEKSAFSLTCVNKLLPKPNCLHNIPVNFWIDYCKKLKNLHSYNLYILHFLYTK